LFAEQRQEKGGGKEEETSKLRRLTEKAETVSQSRLTSHGLATQAGLTKRESTLGYKQRATIAHPGPLG
jgi:hypothetical protein